ncbi:hypothetical protein DAPPUDRAFT_247152 [Daphnia pulex]|uniref:Uncharacterized protein n=1 Tax=Daphnia pulex TaxID=6669 RepID=E9GRV4_DAPPU|nr:hypothetical protein DAPPUDRAFT_247152 [Daphnia pulex]|eukprot:EFX77841.1 hypothetical protein DAPPUDRAFT_247152 [Daphnia pulex]
MANLVSQVDNLDQLDNPVPPEALVKTDSPVLQALLARTDSTDNPVSQVDPDSQVNQVKMDSTELQELLAFQADPDQLDLKAYPVLQVSMAAQDRLDPLDRLVALKVNQVQLVNPATKVQLVFQEAPALKAYLDHKENQDRPDIQAPLVLLANLDKLPPLKCQPSNRTTKRQLCSRPIKRQLNSIPPSRYLATNLPEKEKEAFRRLMEKRNRVIDEKIKILDKIIIAKRPGNRSYTGDQLSVPIPEKEKALENKMYYCDEFRKSVSKKPNWCDNVLDMQTTAVKEWPTLSENIQEKYIHRAKEEFEAYTGFAEGNEVVDLILFKTLIYGNFDYY